MEENKQLFNKHKKTQNEIRKYNKDQLEKNELLKRYAAQLEKELEKSLIVSILIS